MKTKTLKETLQALLGLLLFIVVLGITEGI
jgi:hypothetical protein